MKTVLLMCSVCCSCCFGEVIRDPTQPLNFSGNVEGGLKLSSIFIGKNRKFAVINGARLQEGDAIAGKPDARVKKIGPREVIVFENGESRSLNLATGFRP